MGREKFSAHYDLQEIKRLIRIPSARRITKVAADGASQLGFDLEHIIECIDTLEERHLQKSMEAMKSPGLWQDVYKRIYLGRHLYLKLQAVGEGSGRLVVVVSFKRDESFEGGGESDEA